MSQPTTNISTYSSKQMKNTKEIKRSNGIVFKHVISSFPFTKCVNLSVIVASFSAFDAY